MEKVSTVKLFFQNLPPQPRNATHEKTPRGMRLSDMARAFQDDIRERLDRTGLKDHFAGCNAIKLFLTVHTPHLKFFTQEGKVSKTSIDFDAHKLFVDELARYFNFNDGLIIDFQFEKVAIDGDWGFEVIIMDWSEEVCQVRQESIVILTRSSQGYQILN